jgi:sugar phosphate isomerase/epimerase
MHNWMRSEPLEVTLARLKRCGYGSIEIKGEPDQYDSAEVRELLAKYELDCWGVITLTLGERNLAAKDEAQRAASVQYMKDCVTFSKELNGQEISIVPATVGKVEPDATPEEEWGWVVDGLKEIHEHATAAGIRMAIEPLNRFETYFVNRGDQALALADAVAPDVGVCLDAFHMNIEEVDAARGRLRRRPHRRVRGSGRPHTGEQVPGRSRDQPGRHLSGGTAVHHRPRQQSALGGVLRHARREMRHDPAAADLRRS